jgi:hypothetical protein
MHAADSKARQIRSLEPYPAHTGRDVGRADDVHFAEVRKRRSGSAIAGPSDARALALGKIQDMLGEALFDVSEARRIRPFGTKVERVVIRLEGRTAKIEFHSGRTLDPIHLAVFDEMIAEFFHHLDGAGEGNPRFGAKDR